MPESVNSEPFRALAADLKTSGHTGYGARLENVLHGVRTTSSELIVELGVVVVDIRQECRPLTAHQRALIKECLKQVRRAWPGFGLFSWLPRGHSWRRRKPE